MSFLRALRPAHWSKNLLVFAGLFLGGRIASGEAWMNALIALAALSLAASAGYLANDVRDVAADRLHPVKRQRPVAAGALEPRAALILAGALSLAALGLGALVNAQVLAAVIAYLCLALAYSLGAKRMRWLDVMLLAGLFTLRVIAGTAAAEVTPSPWLLSFSLTFFLSLALAKRADELAVLAAPGPLPGRPYGAAQARAVRALGLCSAAGAVVLLGIYVMEHGYDPSHYPDSAWLWGFPAFTALFLARIWALAAGGRLHGDAAIAAWRDGVTLIAGAGLAISFALATSLL